MPQVRSAYSQPGLPVHGRSHAGSGKVSLHKSEFAEVDADEITASYEAVRSACAGADDLALTDRAPSLADPVQQPGQAGDRVSHRLDSGARLDVIAVEVKVEAGVRQVDRGPVGGARADHQGRAAPVVVHPAEVAAERIPVSQDRVAYLA